MTTETNLTTSLTTINPQTDPEVMSFYNEAVKLKEYAEARVIATAEDTKSATNDLSMIAKLKKAMESKRKDYLSPFQEHVKFVNETYKVLMAPVESADIITRGKVAAYLKEQERIRHEQEEINRKRMEAAEAEMKLKGELTESINLVEVINVQKKVETELGTTNTMKIWKFEVIDKTLVPEDYKQVDMVKVGAVVRASKGSVSIPGIRIYSEETLKVSAR